MTIERAHDLRDLEPRIIHGRRDVLGGERGMTARQTVIRVRSDQTSLSAEVASLLPSEIGRARQSVRRSQATRRTSSIKVTFCPVCGGNKGKNSTRCRDCQMSAQRAGSRIAAQSGRFSFGRGSAARSRVGEAIAVAQPGRVDLSEDQAPSWSRRVRGEGRAHRQEWRRMVIVNGKWIAESETPEGIERTLTDAEAVARVRRGFVR